MTQTGDPENVVQIGILTIALSVTHSKLRLTKKEVEEAKWKDEKGRVVIV